MDKLLVVYNWVLAHAGALAALGAFLLSEVMALLPGVKANGVAQWLLNFFKSKSDASAPQIPSQ